MFRSLRPAAIVVAVLATAGALEETKAGETIKTVRIAGQVTDRGHRPIENVVVVVKVAGSTETAVATTTDQNGRFVFAAVPPKAYDVYFESSGFYPLVRTLAAGNDVELANTMMEVAPIESPIELPLYSSPISQELNDDVEDTSNTLSVCDVLRDLNNLDGRMVSMRGIFSWSHFHGGSLFDLSSDGKPCDKMPRKARLLPSGINLDSSLNPNLEGAQRSSKWKLQRMRIFSKLEETLSIDLMAFEYT